jgi:apolipoprotein N-acyltransferase
MLRRLAKPFRYPVRWLAFVAGGAPAILVFPGPSLSYLAWVALLPGMALFTRATSTREAVARGWWFGAGYLIAMLYWMAAQIGPGLLLLGAVMGFMWSPFAVAVYRLLRPPVSWRTAGAALIVVPSTWLIPEWIRSYQGLGGPWGLYGASQWQHPAMLSLAAVGGVWLVSVVLVLASAGLMLVIGAVRPAVLLAADTSERGEAGETDARQTPVRPPAAGGRTAMAVAGVAVFAVAAVAGPVAFALTPPFPVVRHVTIALVQPGLIHDPAKRADASETLTATLTKTGTLHGVRPDLIVWGESSIAYDLALDRSLLGKIESLSAQAGAEILVSQDSAIPASGGQQGGQQKVAVLVSPNGVHGRYVKTRLVPFGEYIPFRQQLGWLTKVSKAASSNMIPGDGAHLLTVTGASGGPLPIGLLVCFESAFPDMSRVDADAGAQLIVYQSSTSTFQGTWGPDQHASLAAVRAAETGRPTVQASLTGDTVAFDARGRQVAWFGQDGHGVVTVRLALPAAGVKTFYDQAGDYVMWAGVAVSALAALVMLLRRRGFLADPIGNYRNRTAEFGEDTEQRVPR